MFRVKNIMIKLLKFNLSLDKWLNFLPDFNFYEEPKSATFLLR
jgi:hypothetical protein